MIETNLKPKAEPYPIIILWMAMVGINGSKFKHDLLKIAEDGDQGNLQGDNPIVVKDDRTQTPVVQTRVYAKRWYILAVFSVLGIMQVLQTQEMRNIKRGFGFYNFTNA